MWQTLHLSLLFLVITTEIIEARSRVKWKSPLCKSYVSNKPNFSAVEGSVSVKKCLEYEWEVKDNFEREAFGRRCSRNVGIAGGISTTIATFPHMAAIGWKTVDDKWAFLCGGSLISHNFVLTAAHCTNTSKHSLDIYHLKELAPQLVRMGTTNIEHVTNNEDETPLDRNILNIIVHPNYKSPKKYYDIALINIERVEKFTKYVHPACLHNTMDPINHQLDATGWGLTSNNNSSSILQAAALEIVPSINCRGVYHNRNWKKFSEHQFCAGRRDRSAGTCKGDSGAPLQYRKPDQSSDINMSIIVGITSFGRTCTDMGIYVKISYFTTWIERHVWPERETTNTFSVGTVTDLPKFTQIYFKSSLDRNNANDERILFNTRK